MNFNKFYANYEGERFSLTWLSRGRNHVEDLSVDKKILLK